MFIFVQAFVEFLLCFLRRDVSDGAVKPLGVVPVDPFQGFPFDLGDRLPGAEEVDDLGLEQPDDAFGQGVVIGIADAADCGVDPCLGQTFGVFDRQILAAAIRMMDQPVCLGRCSLTDRLVQGVYYPAGDCAAICREGRTKLVVMEVGTRQPTILRAKTSITKAT